MIHKGEILKFKKPSGTGKFKLYDQLSDDLNLYTEFQLRKLIKERYNLTPEEYYNLIVHGDKNYKHYCKNPECNKELKFLGITSGYKRTCNRNCADRYHSYNMKDIWKTGVYDGTSNFITYNSLDSTRELRREEVQRSIDDKSSRAFGSEYHRRETNCGNIKSRYSNDVNRYIYLVISKYHPNYIKLGTTNRLDRRINELKAIEVIFLYKGGSHDIAELERDLFREFIDYTIRLDGKFSEYLDMSCKNNLINRMEELYTSSTTNLKRCTFNLINGNEGLQVKLDEDIV